MQFTNARIGTLFQRGVVLEEAKEPALSRTVKQMDAEPCPLAALRAADRPEELSPDGILAYAREARILDETDGLPLWEKIRRFRGTDPLLFVNAIDDEPYVSSKMGPMLFFREETACGIRLLARAVGAAESAVLIYRPIADMELSVPRAIGDFPVRKIGGRYPARIRVEEALGLGDGRETPALFVGPCSLIHLCRAVREGRAQSTAFVTVAGNCVGFPRNVEAPLGTPVPDLIRLCGLAENPTRIVLGGPITGRSVRDPRGEELAVDTAGVLVIRDDRLERLHACIRCGRCANACPQGLNPMRILQAVRDGDGERLALLGIQDCTGCMCCSYICPSRQPIAAEIRNWREKTRGREKKGGGAA